MAWQDSPGYAILHISLIVPSFEQKDFLRECLQSLLQAGQAEIIVIDGGSKDGSVDVIREFEPHLKFWVSEPDNGQADAINKGLRQATGDIWAFVNSDDLLEEGSLWHVLDFFRKNPDARWLSGTCRVFGADIDDWYLKPAGVSSQREVLTPWDRSEQYIFPQSGACFMHRTLIDQIGAFDPSYHFSMDIEYYTRATLRGGITQHITDSCLAAWRWHPDAKSFQKGIAYAFREDEVRIAEEYTQHLSPADQQLIWPQIAEQKRQILVRKAHWFQRQGEIQLARSLLWQAVKEYPTCLIHRPWLGVLRRLFFNPVGARRP